MKHVIYQIGDLSIKKTFYETIMVVKDPFLFRTQGFCKTSRKLIDLSNVWPT